MPGVCQGRGHNARLEDGRQLIPRSSNGRTAAFGAVNRGSNPCRGATSRFSTSLPAWFPLTASARAPLCFPKYFCGFAALAALSVRNPTHLMSGRNRHGSDRRPGILCANSPHSPLNRSEPLTGGLRPGGHKIGFAEEAGKGVSVVPRPRRRSRRRMDTPSGTS